MEDTLRGRGGRGSAQQDRNPDDEMVVRGIVLPHALEGGGDGNDVPLDVSSDDVLNAAWRLLVECYSIALRAAEAVGDHFGRQLGPQREVRHVLKGT